MRYLVGLTLLLAACDSTTEPITFDPATVELLRVFDGDSFEVDQPGREVRLLGLNAPERFDCLGDESASQLGAFLSDTPLTLEGPAESDQFGRELRYASTEGRDVGAIMVRLGLAIATSDDHPRRQAYAEAETAAVAEGAGMWAADACGEASGASLSISALEFDAPGADGDNPNGEWITIHNEGREAVELAGWGIRDETSRHRYQFPMVSLGAGDSLVVFSGCGDNSLGPTAELHWCAEGAVWNNDGDTALLQDLTGNVVDRLVYGAKK